MHQLLQRHRPGIIVPHDTPTHNRLSSTVPQTSTNVIFERPFVEAALEIKGKFWGPVSVEEFFDQYLDVEADPIPEIEFEAVKNVTNQKLETEMYDPLIAALDPFCRGIKLVNTSAVDDPESVDPFGHKIKPDLGIYEEKDIPKLGKRKTQAKLMLGYGELKNDFLCEPFAPNQPLYSINAEDPFERDTYHSRDTRGQLTVYANAIQASQYRTHSFSFFINRNNCRLIHWSRSCAIVTRQFDYTKEGYLHEFFWRLSHASKKTRGIDTTFRSPEDVNEAARARGALGLGPTDQIQKVGIKDSVTKKTTHYIVHNSFTNNHIFPLGRGTRCFKAFDCQTEAIVLLKDSWRVSKYEPEGDIYRELHEKGVRYIPKFITAGDVSGITHSCGKVGVFCNDTTETPPRVHYHYRLVLGSIGNPLKSFLSTWELVNAVKCALIAHWDAVTKAKILHRDISLGNIMIMGEDGMLIDWELSKRMDQGLSARSEEKTGTFQFISARLLMQTTKIHNIGDDLESFVYVLAMVAVKYARNSMDPQHRNRALKKFDFDGVAGVSKAELLGADTNSVRGFKLDQKPFSDLLKDIFRGFGLRYGSSRYDDLERDNPQAIAAELAKLETHDWLYNVLDKAHKDDEWKAAGDGAVEQTISSVSNGCA